LKIIRRNNKKQNDVHLANKALQYEEVAVLIDNFYELRDKSIKCPDMEE